MKQKEIRSLISKAMEINMQVDAMIIQVCKELGCDKQTIKFSENRQPTFLDGTDYFTILSLKLVGEEKDIIVGDALIEKILEGTKIRVNRINFSLYPINKINLLTCLAFMLND